MIAAAFILYLKIVAESQAKAAAVIAFLALQSIFSIKAPMIVLTGCVGGVACVLAGFAPN